MDYKDMNAIGIVRLMLTDGVITVEQAANYFPEFKQKPVWNEKDEKMLNHIIGLLEGLPNLQKWLNSVKDRIQQQTNNEVKPKFHEGDWIIHQGTKNIYQVIARIDNQYQLKYGDNYTMQNCADVDRCAKLWDITKEETND